MTLRGDVAKLLAPPGLANAAVWAVALALFRDQPVLPGAPGASMRCARLIRQATPGSACAASASKVRESTLR